MIYYIGVANLMSTGTMLLELLSSYEINYRQLR